MSKRTVIDCDVCKKECGESIHLDIPNGTERYHDGHTSQIDFLSDQVDMCPDCAERLLQYMFQHSVDQEGKLNRIKPRRQHTGPDRNHAIRLALQFCSIKEKEAE